MQYRKDRKGNDISLLGFGCMRFEGSGTGEYFQKANDGGHQTGYKLL